MAGKKKTTMRMPKGLDEVERFFWKNAGYSYNPATETPAQGRANCARALAKAERDGSDAGLTFEWALDDITNEEHEDSEEPYYYLWCVLCRDANGKAVASCGGVDFGRDKEPWGDPYRRVMEAELASEALD